MLFRSKLLRSPTALKALLVLIRKSLLSGFRLVLTSSCRRKVKASEALGHSHGPAVDADTDFTSQQARFDIYLLEGGICFHRCIPLLSARSQRLTRPTLAVSPSASHWAPLEAPSSRRSWSRSASTRCSKAWLSEVVLDCSSGPPTTAGRSGRWRLGSPCVV